MPLLEKIDQIPATICCASARRRNVRCGSTVVVLLSNPCRNINININNVTYIAQIRQPHMRSKKLWQKERVLIEQEGRGKRTLWKRCSSELAQLWAWVRACMSLQGVVVWNSLLTRLRSTSISRGQSRDGRTQACTWLLWEHVLKSVRTLNLNCTHRNHVVSRRHPKKQPIHVTFSVRSNKQCCVLVSCLHRSRLADAEVLLTSGNVCQHCCGRWPLPSLLLWLLVTQPASILLTSAIAPNVVNRSLNIRTCHQSAIPQKNLLGV